MRPSPSEWNRRRSAGLAITAAVLWGVSGTAAQVLFDQHLVGPLWLAAVRMLASGLLLEACALARKRRSVLTLLRSADAGRLLAYGLFGLLSVQVTYVLAIAAGSAAAATLLQSLSPALIAAWTMASTRRWPSPRLWIALGCAFFGTVLLLTDGRVAAVALPPAAILWGLASAAALASTTLLPQPLSDRHGALATVAGGQLIGGLVLVPALIRMAPPTLPMTAVALLLVVVVAGTLVPFVLYTASLRFLRPAETGLMLAAEPLVATLLGVLWLHVRLGVASQAGAALIVVSLMLQTASRRQDSPHDGAGHHATGLDKTT